MTRNAIIMAAGTASRFAPLSYEKPKALLRVKGEVLIERQIRQLKEAQITDITIVVGYMAEKFYYLHEKFGVRIVLNTDYNLYNNTSSIIKVIEQLDNTYICSSDNYFPQNVFLEEPTTSYYSALYSNEDTNEYCITTDHNDNIISVTVGGASSWFMVGHVYFARNFSSLFRDILKREYINESTRYEYWEDVYIRHIKDLPPMKIHKYQEHEIEEFDSLEELRLFDKTYINNTGCQMFKNICQALKCEEKDIIEINVLKKGMTNCSFAFTCDIDKNKYVYRHPGAGTQELINRRNEYHSLLLAKKMHLDDTFIAMDPVSGWKLSHYIEDVETLNSNTIQTGDNINVIASIYRKLHNSSAEMKYEFNILNEIEKYDQLINQLGASMYEGWETIKSKLYIIKGKLTELGVTLCPCHNDAVPENFIKTRDQKIFLIDWEYSGMNDPLADIASLFLESSFSEEKQKLFLFSYYNGESPQNTATKILCYQILWDFLWAQWTIIKEAKGDNFGTYGADRFNRGLTNLQKLLN